MQFYDDIWIQMGYIYIGRCTDLTINGQARFIVGTEDMVFDWNIHAPIKIRIGESSTHKYEHVLGITKYFYFKSIVE